MIFLYIWLTFSAITIGMLIEHNLHLKEHDRSVKRNGFLAFVTAAILGPFGFGALLFNYMAKLAEKK